MNETKLKNIIKMSEVITKSNIKPLYKLTTTSNKPTSQKVFLTLPAKHIKTKRNVIEIHQLKMP